MKRISRKILSVLTIASLILCCTSCGTYKAARNTNTVHNQGGSFTAKYISEWTWPKKFDSQRKKAFKVIDKFEQELAKYPDHESFWKKLEKLKCDDDEFSLSFNAEYCYFGDMSGNYPDGYGILFSDDVWVAEEHGPVLVGHFKKGKIDDYAMVFSSRGIDYETNNLKIGKDYYAGKGDYIKYYQHSTFKETSNHYVSSVDPIKFIIMQPCVSYEGELDSGLLSDAHKEGKGATYDDLFYEASDVMYSYDPDSCYGGVIYEGEWKNDKHHGKGILYNPRLEVKIYEGEWKNGKYHGKGTLYNSDGSVKYKGKFKNGDIK